MSAPFVPTLPTPGPDGASTVPRFHSFALATALLLPTAVTWIYLVALAGHPGSAQRLAYGLGKTLQFALLIACVLGWRRPVRLRPQGTAGLVGGLGFGVLSAGAVFGFYAAGILPADQMAAAAAAIRQKTAGLGVDTPARFAALGVAYALGHSLLEEVYWRWFVFGELQRRLKPAAAIGLSSAAFAAHHVVILGAFFGWRSAATPLFALAVAAGGAVWAEVYRRSGSLLCPWASHALVDAALFTVGYRLVGFGA